MKKIYFLFLVISTTLFAQEKDSIALRYSKDIDRTDLSKNLHVLASDEYEGRETGKKGQKMAAEYIANQFKNAGILPYKDNTYYQPFLLNEISPMPEEIIVRKKQYEGNKDYYNYPGEIEQHIKVKHVLFMGYGIQENRYNDYKGEDVKGKVIMILSGEPFSKDSLSLVSGEKAKSLAGYNKIKTQRAREAGALALLIVVEDIAKDIAENKNRIQSPMMKLESSEEKMPVIYISKEMANDILHGKANIDGIKQKISTTQNPLHLLVKAKLTINIKNAAEQIGSENVLGYIEGGDLKDQLIIVTAHYDHLGKKGTAIFNGADDDGSGTVAVIELAKVFAKAKKEGFGPRRSMLFMTFAGEEKGLLGSSYYVEHPEFPLSNTVADLNIDMIGRIDEKHENNPNYVYLIGSDKLSSTLHNINENANKTYSHLELDYTYNDERDKNRFYYRSDHYNFAKKGIPVIFYFNGVHADYHKETDEVDKINFGKIENISRLVFFTAWELANRNERIAVDSNKK